MVWGGRREEGSGWGTHVYLWWIHFDIWQNQYNIVKLKNKKKILIKQKKKRKKGNSSERIFKLFTMVYVYGPVSLWSLPHRLLKKAALLILLCVSGFS